MYPLHHTSFYLPASGISTLARRLQFGRTLPWLMAALLVAGGGALWWYKTHPSASASNASTASTTAAKGGAGSRRFGGGSNAQPVSIELVRRQDIRATVYAIGNITASNTAVVRAQVSGVLQSLNFKEGEQVKAGQLLAQVDPRAFQASVNQAEGSLARDKAQLDNANIDLTRYRDLLAKDAVPKQQLDTQAALVRQLEGTVKVDQAAVESARLQLSYARVTAPIAGRVGLKQADLGNVVQPGDANGLVSLTQTRPIAMVFAVPATHLPQITTGLKTNQPLQVQALDRSGKKALAVGRVASIDNAIDPSTDTIKVKALFANADDTLFPNQSVSVSLQLGTLSQVLAVPQAAVLRGAQGFYVYVVNPGNSVNTKVVKPGTVDDGWIAVEGDLNAGDKVVIDGTDRLREGAKVEVIAATAKNGGGTSKGPQRGTSPAASSAQNTTVAPVSSSSAATKTVKTSVTQTQPTSADAAASSPTRGRWMEGRSPEQIEKVKAMNPEERRGWIRQQRVIANDPAAR
jgi:multidrug efflux system membrane fusion protein